MLSGGTLTTPGTSVTVDSSGTAHLDWVSPRAVAMDNAGDAVVAWADQQSNGNWNLMFERYTNSSGTLTPQGAVTIASNVPSSNLDGAVIMVARAPTNGDFVVVWGTATTPTKKDPSGTYATHAQLYDAAGGPIGSSFLVGGSGNNLPKSVAMNDSGFDVLYGSYGGRVTGGYVLTVQRYSYTSSSDAAVGKPISVVTPGVDDGGNGYTSMTMDGNGNFAVGWKDVINNSTTYAQVIDAELFTNAGAGQGVFEVASGGNTLSGGSSGVSYGDVAMDSAGNFVLDWQYYAGNGTPWTVQARQFTTGGIPVQAETNPIIVSTAGNAGGVAETGGGAFDVSWTTPQNELEISTYDPSGNQAQSFAVMSGIGPSVAVDGNNDLFVVFMHDGNNVVGQFYLDPPAPAPTTIAAATDAVFAAYAYPEDDDTRG